MNAHSIPVSMTIQSVVHLQRVSHDASLVRFEAAAALLTSLMVIFRSILLDEISDVIALRVSTHRGHQSHVARIHSNFSILKFVLDTV